MILKLPFGRATLAADLRGLRCRELKPSVPRPAQSAGETIRAALDAPLAGVTLAALARGRHNVVVLVPDATRKASLPVVLPEIMADLALAGVEPARIRILVACGTHPAAAEAEVATLVGALPAGVGVIQHDARDDATLAVAGRLPDGQTIRLNRILLDADLVVAVSTVQHHYFAGFGGGPKLVFPGVAGYDEIQANHGRVIDLTTGPARRDPRCEPGRIVDNPVAREIAAAAGLRPPDVALLMINGVGGAPVWAASGPLEAVFPVACTRVRDWFECDAARFERMVVAAGGYPSDATLIQAHKALDAACRFAADGAEVLFVAACDGGLGSPAMEPFVVDPRPEAIIARLADHYVQYGHTTLRIVEKTARCRILACTAMDEAVVRRLGFEPVASAEAVLDEWRARGSHPEVGIMVAGAVFPRRSD